MKILIIGAKGTLGQRISTTLAQRHEIITAGRNSGDFKVDISSPASISNLFI